MKGHRLGRAVLFLACWGSWIGGAQAAAEYELREGLDLAWPRQLIGFPVSFDAGRAQDIAVVTADGQPIAFQAPAAEAARHADGSLAAARVYVMTALAPGQTIVFRALAEGQRPNLPPADLRILEGDGLVTLETGPVGVRLPLGAFTGNDIPAPFRGFKLTTGRWTGSSRLMGDPAPERLTATIAERGPVFAEVELRYAYPEARGYTLRCRVIAGEPVALFSETFDTEPGSRYHRNLRYAPLRFVQGRFGYSDDIERSHVVRLTLNDFRPHLTDEFAPVHARIEAADPWLTTLHPWNSWHGGTMMHPLRDDRDYLGLLVLRAGHWVRPLENLGLVKHQDGEVYVLWPINDGRREWAVHFGAPADAQPSGTVPYPHFENTTPLRRALITYGQTALDTVKDWTLAWADAVPVKNPVSVVPAGDLPAAHARFAEVPELAEFRRDTETHWQKYWAGKTEESVKPPAYGRQDGRGPDVRSGITALYLCTGKEEHARDQFLIARALLDYGIRQTLVGAGHTGYHFGHNYGMLHIANYANSASLMVDTLLGSPFLSDAEKAQLRARLAFYAYLLIDPDYWPPTNEIGKGNFNMVAAHDGAVGVIGAVLAGHPRAAEWRQVGQATVERVVANSIRPDGVLMEGTHYSGVTVDSVLPFMALLSTAGGTDHFQDERFKRGLRWYASTCPPVDVRFGRAYLPPYGYSHPTDSSQSARWAVAAAMTAKSDPEFAALMMDTWARQGRPTSLQIGGHFLAGMIDPALMPAQPPVRESASWPNFGAVLRAHAATDKETYLSIAHWGGWTSENGAFHLYAKGVPLSLVFGARAFFNPGAWCSGLTMNRIVFDRREEPRGKIHTGAREWASLPAADLFGAEFHFTRLQSRAAVFEGDEEDRGRLELSEPRDWPAGAPKREAILRGNDHSRFGEIKAVPLQTWWRRILFVKDTDPLGPNYFLIHDRLTGTLPSEWNLWVMADAAPAIEGQLATFTGRFGVDLDVFMAEAPRKIVTGAWGPDGNWGNKFERQRLLQLQRDAHEPYRVLLYPRMAGDSAPEFTALDSGCGVRLRWPNRSDWLFLAGEPTAVRTDDFEFIGRCGLAQQGEGWTRLTLLAGDKISLGEVVLMQGREVVEEVRTKGEGALSVSAMLAPERRVVGEAVGEAREVVIQVPRAYAGLTTLRIDGEPAPLRPDGYGIYAFQLSPGAHRFEIH